MTTLGLKNIVLLSFCSGLYMVRLGIRLFCPSNLYFYLISVLFLHQFDILSAHSYGLPKQHFRSRSFNTNIVHMKRFGYCIHTQQMFDT